MAASRSFAWASLIVALLLAPGLAQARGKRSAVPDLRQAAGEHMQGEGRAVHELPLTIHIATRGGGSPVASEARIARWIREANAALGAANVRVTVRSVRHMPDGWSRVTKWRERRQLARYAPRDGSIHVFVIDELDTPRQRRVRRRVRGLHWRYRGFNADLRAREYVVVTQGAPTTTFVHELGHLFGLRHSSSSDNIMCSCRRASEVGFTRQQSSSIGAGVERYTARHGHAYGSGRADRSRRRRR